MEKNVQSNADPMIQKVIYQFTRIIATTFIQIDSDLRIKFVSLVFLLVITETFGICRSGSTDECCPTDVACNVECNPDHKCRYADWLFPEESGN